MILTRKTFENFPNNFVSVNGMEYIPDYIIDFPIDKDEINIENCICVFSIKNRKNPLVIQYVGGEYFKELNSNNIRKSINGYLPESVFCFTETEFPLQDFLKQHNI